VVAYLVSVQSCIWVGHEKLADKVLGLVGDCLPRGRAKVVLTALYLLEKRKVILVIEWRRAG